MRYSVKNRLKVIIENSNRMQELAGLSDPEAGYVAPVNAYGDDFNGIIKRFGKDIVNRIVLFVRTKMNAPVTLEKIGEEDLNIRIMKNQDSNIPTADFVIRMGGYMHDSKVYVFNLGYKDQMGQVIFKNKFTMDIQGNLSGWQNLPN